MFNCTQANVIKKAHIFDCAIRVVAIAGFAAFCPIAEAVTVKTKSGAVYENTQLFKAEPDRIIITYGGAQPGMATIRFEDLTTESQGHYASHVSSARDKAQRETADKESALLKKINTNNMDLNEWSNILLGKSLDEALKLLGQPDVDNQKAFKWSYYHRVKLSASGVLENLHLKHFNGIIVDIQSNYAALTKNYEEWTELISGKNPDQVKSLIGYPDSVNKDTWTYWNKCRLEFAGTVNQLEIEFSQQGDIYAVRVVRCE